MSCVVDASVLIAALLDASEDGEWAEELIASGGLIAPDLALVEATNILRRLARAKLITAANASAARSDLMNLHVETFSFEPFADRVWELRQNITCYDACYVSLAEALSVPLATLDQRLARATGPSCQFLHPGNS